MTELPEHCPALFRAMDHDVFEPWLRLLPGQLEHALFEKKHGDWPRWRAAVDAMPDVDACTVDLNQAAIQIGQASEISEQQQQQLREQLQVLSPWRKGPFEFFGVHVDTEWHSDWKWDRVKDAIAPLQGRTVLDVGCGNGYFTWRMVGAGAKLVIGIDPSRLFLMQYLAAYRYLGDRGAYVLPLGIDDVPRQLQAFDTVFSMGVIYHRRSPIDHLLHLRECLQPGGQLVLETLIVEGDAQQVLVPEARYAQMNNVWFIPSCGMLERWMQRAGFKDIKLADVSVTSTAEQRVTDWMQFQSLADFLDPQDSTRTIEGYPAPRRAVMVATAP